MEVDVKQDCAGVDWKVESGKWKVEEDGKGVGPS